MSEEEDMIARARAAIKPTDSIELVRAFEHLAAVGWEYGTRRYVTDGWERGDRYGDGREYVEARSISDRLNSDPSTVTGVRDLTRAVRRRKAGAWEPVE